MFRLAIKTICFIIFVLQVLSLLMVKLVRGKPLLCLAVMSQMNFEVSFPTLLLTFLITFLKVNKIKRK